MNPRLRGESYQHCICSLLVLFVCLDCFPALTFGLSTIINSSNSLSQAIYLRLLGFSGEKSQSLQTGDSIHLFSSYSLDTKFYKQTFYLFLLTFLSILIKPLSNNSHYYSQSSYLSPSIFSVTKVSCLLFYRELLCY